MTQITEKQAVAKIFATGGRIFSALFTKKDGTLRDMTCRLHVSKYVNGTGRSFDPADYDLIGVFDMQNDGHRMINVKTLETLTISGEKFAVTR